MASRKAKQKGKSRKVPAQKPRKSSNKKQSLVSKKKVSAASRVIYRINGKFASKKQWQLYEKNRKRRERRKEAAPTIPKFKDVKKKRKPRNYARDDDTKKLKHHAVADLSGTLLEVEVTSQKERYTDIHMQLRKAAIEKGRFFVPDERIRNIATPFNRGLHKSFQVGKFLTDETVEDISNQAYSSLITLERKQVGKARFYLAFHMTEYGLETYGSDKGSIATKDEISTDTLHWTAWGSAGGREPEDVYRMARAKLHEFLKKSSRTTVAIESIDVTMIYENAGEN